MSIEKSSRQPWLLPVIVAAGCLAAAHALQALLGHDWFASHAFAVAVPVAVVAGGLLALRARSRSVVERGADWVMTSCTLLLLMLVPQWVEGSVSAGHGVTLDAIRECGLPTLLAAYLALYLVTVVGWARLVDDLMRPGH